MVLRKRRATHALAEPATVKVKKPFSSGMWLLVIAVTAIVGFAVGNRSDQLLGLIPPLFGQKVYTAPIDLSSVEKTFRTLKANYDGNIDDATLIEGANRGMVSAIGDTYTVFLNKDEAATFDNELTGNIGGGVGAEISIRNDKPTIIRVLKDNPAIKAGLLAGDTIVRVNDESVDGKTVDQVVSRIRGEVGTTVKIEVLRGTQLKEFTVTRAIINNPSVDSTVNGKLGTITISRFDSETGNLARAAAQQLKSAGVTAVILDLRGNGGGYVDAAQDVTGIWLDNKIIVTERAGGKVIEELRSGKNPILTDIPTVVLVNRGTASASEIVSGALQDYGVATLVGERTFGKGSVQRLIDLPDGAQLKVTIARWFTPDGKNITSDGISPDITVSTGQEDLNANKDPQLDAAKKQLGL